jgi:hypothetical protein
VSDDYLWDGSGEPDPAVERLERVLSPLRSDRPAPELPAAAGRRPFGGALPALAAAAALLLAMSDTWLSSRGRGASWEVTRLERAPARETVTRVERLRVGEWLETGESSRARVKVGAIGQVEIEPRTRLRLMDAGAASHRLALDHGVLHAWIWAPPGRFFVDTPSAVAVDLGCEYTLAVDETGAACATRPGKGPGTPYYEDASAELTRALAEVDFGPAAARADALRRVLAAARPKDALSLWHLLARLDGAGRPAVYDHLAELVAPPDGVTREGVLAGDRRMLDRWWDALGLGAAGWWRRWLTHLPSDAS